MPMRLRVARGLIPFVQLAFASCGAQTTAVSSREPLAEEHTGYRLEYVVADRAVAGSVRPVVSGGFAPVTFAALWASPANYALAGSVVSYINQQFGVDPVRRLLTVRTEAELLTALSTNATTLLREWRAWVLAQP